MSNGDSNQSLIRTKHPTEFECYQKKDLRELPVQGVFINHSAVRIACKCIACTCCMGLGQI